MNISLTPTFERHIREKIESGLYGNASEVVRAALRIMIETERKASGAALPIPKYGEVMERLEALRPALRKEGVERLRLTGSVARGDAKPGSDVDILVDLAPGVEMGLLDKIGLKHLIEDHLGYGADVLMADSVDPLARDSILADAVTVFG